jgi:hypothetical protein
VIWWPNYVLSVLLLTNTCCIITAGHVLEDEVNISKGQEILIRHIFQSENIFLELTTLQCYTWNMKNKKLFLTILTTAIRPINVKFSENFVVNNRMLLFVSELFHIYNHLKFVTIFLFFYRYTRVSTRSFQFFSMCSETNYILINTSLMNSNTLDAPEQPTM